MRGRDKLLEPVRGMPLLARQVDVTRATGHPVYVTLPVEPGARDDLIAGATPVPVPDADEGIAASLRAAVRALPAGVAGLLLLLADLPDIETADLRAVLAEAARHPDCPVRGATQDGRPGHPVYLPAGLFPHLLRLTGDRGAAALLAREAVRHVPLPGERAVTDLDTPEAWAAWRTAHSGG